MNTRRVIASSIPLRPKQRTFLSAFAELGNLRAAAPVAQVRRRSHYYWLKKPEYAAAFAEAREEAVCSLEAEARRRAVDGIQEPVLCRGKPVYEKMLDRKTGQLRATKKLATRRRYSDTLLMFLLKGMCPEKYRDNWKGERPGRAITPAPVRIDLKKLDDSELMQLKSIARKVEIGSEDSGL